MSGMASTTRSPSSFSTRWMVVCVAGCCGPKFRVHRYGCGSSWARSRVEETGVRGIGQSRGKSEVGIRKGEVESALGAIATRSPNSHFRLPNSDFISALGSCNHRDVVPLAAALERVVLAERVGRELLRQDEPAQVR